MHYNEAITNHEGFTMLAFPTLRSGRFIAASKIAANPAFYSDWSRRFHRRLMRLELHSDQLHSTSYQFQQIAAISAFAYCVVYLERSK